MFCRLTDLGSVMSPTALSSPQGAEVFFPDTPTTNNNKHLLPAPEPQPVQKIRSSTILPSMSKIEYNRSISAHSWPETSPEIKRRSTKTKDEGHLQHLAQQHTIFVPDTPTTEYLDESVNINKLTPIPEVPRMVHTIPEIVMAVMSQNKMKANVTVHRQNQRQNKIRVMGNDMHEMDYLSGNGRLSEEEEEYDEVDGLTGDVVPPCDNEKSDSPDANGQKEPSLMSPGVDKNLNTPLVPSGSNSQTDEGAQITSTPINMLNGQSAVCDNTNRNQDAASAKTQTVDIEVSDIHINDKSVLERSRTESIDLEDESPEAFSMGKYTVVSQTVPAVIPQIVITDTVECDITNETNSPDRSSQHSDIHPDSNGNDVEDISNVSMDVLNQNEINKNKTRQAVLDNSANARDELNSSANTAVENNNISQSAINQLPSSPDGKAIVNVAFQKDDSVDSDLNRTMNSALNVNQTVNMETLDSTSKEDTANAQEKRSKFSVSKHDISLYLCNNYYTRTPNLLFSKITNSICTGVIIESIFPVFMVTNQQFHVKNRAAFLVLSLKKKGIFTVIFIGKFHSLFMWKTENSGP